MKKWMTLILVCLLLAGAAGCDGKQNAAVVNGEPISMEALDEEVASFAQGIEQSGISIGNPEDEEYQRILREEVLNMMIRKTLLAQEMETRGIEISTDGAEQYMEALKAAYGDEGFETLLTMNGLDEEGFIEDYAFNEALATLQQELTADVRVTEEEVRAYFEANRESFVRGEASHILVQFNPAEATDAVKAEKRERVEAILARLADGEDFAAVASETSDDTSAANGGSLGQSFSMMDSPYVDVFTVAALELSEGEYTTEPVESQFGYHIIRLDRKIEDFDELRADVEAVLLQSEQDAFFADYVSDLMDGADIENHVVEEEPEEQPDDTQS